MSKDIKLTCNHLARLIVVELVHDLFDCGTDIDNNLIPYRIAFISKGKDGKETQLGGFAKQPLTDYLTRQLTKHIGD